MSSSRIFYILKFSGLFEGMDGGEFSLLHRRVPSCPLLHIQVDLPGIIYAKKQPFINCFCISICMCSIIYANKSTLISCYRTNKSEGTTLFLADVLSACYGKNTFLLFTLIIILFVIFTLVLVVVVDNRNPQAWTPLIRLSSTSRRPTSRADQGFLFVLTRVKIFCCIAKSFIVILSGSIQNL